MFDLIKNFRHTRRLESHSEIHSSTYSAFLVKESFESSKSVSFKGKAIEPPEYIYDRFIGGANCFYLNSRRRLFDWKSDTQTQRKIDDDALKNREIEFLVLIIFILNKITELFSVFSGYISKDLFIAPSKNETTWRRKTPRIHHYHHHQVILDCFRCYLLQFSLLLLDMSSNHPELYGSITRLCNRTLKHRFVNGKEGNSETIIASTQVLPTEAYRRMVGGVVCYLETIRVHK